MLKVKEIKKMNLDCWMLLNNKKKTLNKIKKRKK